MPPPGSSSGSNPIKPAELGPIIFVLGAPGSGKGTLCSRFVEELPGSFRHLSVGDYLRELCSNGGFERRLQRADVHGDGALSPDEIARYLEENKLLPPGTIIPLIKSKLLDDGGPSGVGWLIDGFPRDIETARAFEKKIKKPDHVIVLLCKPLTAKKRFLERKRSTTDDEMLFEKRLDEYQHNERAICEHYKNKMIGVRLRNHYQCISNLAPKSTVIMMLTYQVSANDNKDECWNDLVRALRKFPGFEELKLDEFPF
ncbi:hypothetical protein Daus18300_006666 [Diaporthe australafricana]|uniref:Adenylate kinase n=1 Tax=Diaporthe australafricana TaxID=127596 RepID=A0ABR3WTD1_9PEZI